MYDVPSLGLNYRMSEMQAALGRSQVRRLKDIFAKRAELFGRYRRLLGAMKGVRLVDSTNPKAVSSHYCVSVEFESPYAAKRDEIVMRLNAAGIGTSIYYPQPVPRMTFYKKKYGIEPSTFSNASQLSDHSVALPLGMHLEPADIDLIVASLADILKSFN
jgi:dTDP-4-amino-4,6-dideoxygalactose transaminase